jgi:hypothetical protein
LLPPLSPPPPLSLGLLWLPRALEEAGKEGVAASASAFAEAAAAATAAAAVSGSTAPSVPVAVARLRGWALEEALAEQLAWWAAAVQWWLRAGRPSGYQQLQVPFYTHTHAHAPLFRLFFFPGSELFAKLVH